MKKKFKREEKYCVLMWMSSRERIDRGKFAHSPRFTSGENGPFPISARFESVAEEIVYNRRPENKNQAQPVKPCIFIAEAPGKYVSQDKEQQSEIDHQT
jgi:hypothetical protein